MKDFADKINANKEFTVEAYNYIKTELDRETSKPLRKRDFDHIEQLTSQLAELSGDDYTPDNTNRLYERIRSYENIAKKPVNIFKRFVPVLCCFVLIFTANCVSVATWDMNIVSSVIEISKGGFAVDFGKPKKEIHLPTSEDDPYGFNAKLAEYDIEFETPHYIPKGFNLGNVEYNENSAKTSILFEFYNGKQSISVYYDNFHNEVGQTGIPSDHFNISETEVNGCPAIISKEDNQYTITYQRDKIVFFMFTRDVSYDECEKIVKSIK
ncbi:MAG: DUF4367 domain-containing protein [Ruminococcus sp.]|nr:DUF4367 domain-containing protein [Ruminococcus sp.]